MNIAKIAMHLQQFCLQNPDSYRDSANGKCMEQPFLFFAFEIFVLELFFDN